MNRHLKVLVRVVMIFIFSISLLQVNPFVYNVSALELGYFRSDGSYQVTDVGATWDELQNQVKMSWQDIKDFVTDNWDQIKDTELISDLKTWYNNLDQAAKETFKADVSGI